MGIGCARQSTPTGGEKDEIPPVVVNYSPPNFTTNFSGSGFELEFDEFIQVQNFSAQLIISPPLQQTPEYSIRGKRLIINWNDTLLDNSTYQFNFGKSVVDVNEGNVNPDLIYVFSTGSFIDSLNIMGRVVDAADNTPVDQAAVLIYRGSADSLPTTSPPDYFTLTDANGNFRIRYLPENDYQIFVLKEEASNYLYNGPPEKIGFLEERVYSSLNDSVYKYLVPTFIEKDTSQYISSQTGTDYGYYEIIFNVPTKKADVQFYDPETEKELKALSLLNATKDTLKSWVTFPDRDKLEEVAVYINDDTTFVDTTFWYIETNTKYKEKAKLNITSNATQSRLDLEKSFSLDFNNPLVEVDTSLVFFLEDSVQVYPQNFERLNLNKKVVVNYPFKPTSSYIFKAKPGAFKDVFGVYSDSVSIPFNLRDSEYYGSLTVSIAASAESDSTTKILQVLTGQGKIIAERSYSSSLSTTFKRMKPGNYQVKVIFDKNENGKWDTGVYRDKIQPEKLSIYPEEIEVRSNWEFELEWTPTTPFD